MEENPDPVPRTPHVGPVPCAPQGSGQDEAVRSAEDVTRIYRRMARARADTYLLDLVRALTEEARLKSYTDWRSAVAPAQEATRIYRQLTATRVFVPELSAALSTVLVFLWDMATDVSPPRLPGPETVRVR